MSELARRRNQEEMESLNCIPGLGENKQRPRELGSFFGFVPDCGRPPSLPSESDTGGSRSASVLGVSGSSSRSVSPSTRPMTAPVLSGGRKFHRRTNACGGASDSSQMSSLIWEPSSPTREEITEEPFMEDRVDGKELEATPFFQSENGTVFIKGGHVVNADSTKEMDVLVVKGVITAMGKDLPIPAEATFIDASGKYVIPGGIDTSTHLFSEFTKEELADNFEMGSRAALAGGTTTVVDLVIPKKNSSLIDAFNLWKSEAEENSSCNYAFSVALPEFNDQIRMEMEELSKEQGVNSFKIFMSDKNTTALGREDILKAMQAIRDLGCIAKVHAENGDIIAENEKMLIANGVTGPEGHYLAHSEEVEEEAVRRACIYAQKLNVPLNISSLTSKGAADTVMEFRTAGTVVFGEPAVASLAVDGSHYDNKCWNHAASFVTSPPLRHDPDTKEKLTKFLITGELDLVASDHCSYSSETRSVGSKCFTEIPEGITGIEERMSLVYELGVERRNMDMTKFVDITSTRAAKLLNCYPQKGCIAEGSDADIVIWNPNCLQTLSQKTQEQCADFNIFEGITVHGAPEFVLCNGKISVAEYKVDAGPGDGKFVKATAFPPAIYDLIRENDIRTKPLPVKRAMDQSDDVDGSQADHDDSFGLTTPRGFSSGEVFNKDLGIYQRSLSAHGIRNQQDSSFSLNGGYNQSENGSRIGSGKRASVKVNSPPGGASRSFW